MKSSQTVSFDARLDERDVVIEFERRTTFSVDLHYGADVDGNRGISVTEIDEDYAEDVFVTRCVGPDGAGEVTVPLAELSEYTQQTIKAIIDEWLEAHEPAEPEYDDYPDEGPYGDE